MDVVAVSSGPGSYTGLRIGVSVAKGVCYATDLPLVGVSTLEAIAESVARFAPEKGIIVPVLKSRRGEVYATAYRASSGHALETLLGLEAMTVEALSLFLQSISEESHLLVTGDALESIDFGQHEAPPEMLVIPLSEIPYDAGWLGRVAFSRFASGHQEDVAAFEPSYLTDFVARKPVSIFDRLPEMSGSGSRKK